jgi:ribonuclease HIII
MIMDGSKLESNIQAVREFIQSKGWTITSEKEIQSGYQLVVTDGATSIPINLYSTGKALIQGKASSLQSELTSWWYARNTSSTRNATGRARIGLDESGKGDYFGPLVIGAVYVDEHIEPRLIALGVRDSKLLPDNRILALAEEIKTICPCSGVVIEPKRYNQLYNKIHNLNILLARAHAHALETLLGKVSSDLAIADQFGNESLLLNALQEKGRKIKLEQRTRAEEDTAVAAASILARAKFVQQLEQLSQRVGKTLPKGSWDPSIVTIGREIVAEYGQSMLAEVAKLHFKTTETILQSPLFKGDHQS